MSSRSVVGQGLREVNRLQPLDTLEFNQNRVHHKVDPIAPFKLKPSVDNWDRNLTGHARSACRQFLENELEECSLYPSSSASFAFLCDSSAWFRVPRFPPGELGVIDGFQQARAQSRVYLERGSDDLS